ncbi:MAG: LUD domain-containing protein [Bacteroidales bacterium]|jgi:L-lactate dehydrogenase complex protein LldG|nr:LUD domain-containing protein [Bacteroidales bacterium]
MNESTSKEKVLKAIRDAQIEAERQQKVIDVDMNSPMYPPIQEPLLKHLFRVFSRNNSFFIYCRDEFQVGEEIKKILYQYRYETIFTNDPDIEYLFVEEGIPFINYDHGLRKADVAVTFCECAAIRSGTIALSSRQSTGRTAHTIPEAHFVIVFSDQLVNDISSVYPYLQRKYHGKAPSMLTFVTGASRTDAIQGEMTYGVNGSTRLFVFYVDG